MAGWIFLWRWLRARKSVVFPAPAGPMISTTSGDFSTIALLVKLLFMALSEALLSAGVRGPLVSSRLSGHNGHRAGL